MTTTTATAPPAESLRFYLLNPGTGNTSSSSTLSMGLGPVDSGTLPNFDTDHDGDPGLMIKKDGAGLSTGDTTKYQDWTRAFTTETRLDGPSSLTLWLAAKDFKTDETIGVRAALYLCTPSCTQVATGDWSGSGQSGFRVRTVSFGTVDVTAPAGSTLRVRVVVPDALSSTDVWLAYDTLTYPSRVTVN